ncbi:MAG: hypothetical protein GXO89_11565 [Chlorobi bacterium]|nr:hypothetical protein [Chlorobiota bacterium]
MKSILVANEDEGNLYSGVGDDYVYAGGGEYFDITTGEFVGYDEVFQNYIMPHPTILPKNTNLNSIEFGRRNGVEGIWIHNHLLNLRKGSER